jgi:hypothetical protein
MRALLVTTRPYTHAVGPNRLCFGSERYAVPETCVAAQVLQNRFSLISARPAERDLLSRCYLLASARRRSAVRNSISSSRKYGERSAVPLSRLRVVLEADLDC